MQSKNAITIVHMIAGMLGMHKLYVCYLDNRRWACVEVQYVTSGAYMDTMLLQCLQNYAW